jgi:alginate biosynthesis protein AlgX
VIKSFFLLLVICFLSFSVHAQDAITVERTEEQMVSETICPAMQDDETYKAKGMGVYKKIVGGSDGWVFRSGTDFKTDFELSPKTLGYMKQMQDVFASHGITFVYLVPPTRGLAHGKNATGQDSESKAFQKKRPAALASYSAMLDSMKAQGINVVGFKELNSDIGYFYKRDHHWSPAGAKHAAENVATFLKTQSVYNSLKKTAYITKDMGEYDYKGPIGEVIFPICKLILMAEKTNRFETVTASQTTDSDALFSENTFPEVVLVGTSNSAREPDVANMEGFLKEALSADVYNASIVGAGIDAPLLAYLNSAAYRDHKPKVIIWETPGYYNQNFMHSRIYRQAIPAIRGNCEGKAVAEKKAISIKAADVSLMTGLALKKIQGSDYYIAMNFSDAVKRPMTIHLKYARFTDTYKMTRPPRYPFDGAYYMMLKDSKYGALNSVSVTVPEALIGKTVDISVCKNTSLSVAKK